MKYEEAQSLFESVQNGTFFKNNLNELLTYDGLYQLFITSVITGVIYMVWQKTSGQKSGGLISMVWLLLSGFICTGLAHALFQIFTGIPIKFLSL
ncbi:TPA: hypothetical protein ACYY05_002585 [Staphylococcus aureus]|nr:hypothetical protein [Staphylococcus aureus]